MKYMALYDNFLKPPTQVEFEAKDDLEAEKIFMEHPLFGKGYEEDELIRLEPIREWLTYNNIR